jgi:cyclophilin family peptidyl-prolyl cis-trans isomerase
MKRLAFLAIGVIALGCSPSTDDKTADQSVSPPTTTTDTTPKEADAPKLDPNMIGGVSDLGDQVPKKGEEVGVIDTKFGHIVIRFYNDKAPKTVANFEKLAKSGFYDGTKFHRIIPTFMIQGGDPNSKDSDPSNDGGGGPGYTIEDEFSALSHVRGIISMANTGQPHSAGCQFFICVADHPDLDTKYTIFGRVVHEGTEKPGEDPAGLKVADTIVSQKTNGDKAVDPVPMKISVQTWPLKK